MIGEVVMEKSYNGDYDGMLVSVEARAFGCWSRADSRITEKLIADAGSEG